MSWDDGLEDDSPHKAIAGSPAKRIGVLAGPGTGKTGRGLMRRVVRLLEEGVPGNRILLVSFTRVAAADLRDKIAELDAPGIEHVNATTLHGYCFGLLNKNSVLTVTQRTPRILMEHEVDMMLRDISGNFGNIRKRRQLMEAFNAGWARAPEDRPGYPLRKRDQSFEDAVMQWLREHRCMHIGEVVPEAFKYLSNNPAADELAAFDHLVVDEYQDLNVLEQELLDVLSAAGSLCIAGDDDQSIYSVRYANPPGIRAFLARDEVECHGLTVCGRCPPQVLSMANSVIRRVPSRDKDDLTPWKPEQDAYVAIVQWPDLESEVEGLVSVVASDVNSGRREPGDILVLTNWRLVGEKIRNRLTEVGVDARSFFREEALRTDEARGAFATLRLLVDPNDAPALRVVLGLGDSTRRTDAYKRLLAYCRESRTTPHEVLRGLEHGETHRVRMPALQKRYRKLVKQLDLLQATSLEELVDHLLPEQHPELADLRLIALDALDGANSRDELLSRIVEEITQDDVPQRPEFVRVMSLHKSKGLTAPTVYIAGALDGVLPTIPSNDAAEIEAQVQEGRRLFYVALTRAAEELVISSSARVALADAAARGVRFDKSTIRTQDGTLTVKTIASRYLAELGPHAPKPILGDEWLVSRL